MDQRVAVAHYPEGTGHATKMLAVATEIESRGFDIVLAGGGPGTRFIERNGYDVFRATPVDYIGDYQGGSLARVFRKSIPESVDRVRDLARWLRREDPAVLVTDDVFAVMAATLTNTPHFVVTHNTAAYYDAVIEQVFTWLLGQYQTLVAEDFLYPTLWPPTSADPRGVTRVPPLALDDDAAEPPDAVDVLVVPSAFSTDFGELAEALERDGHDDVVYVGGPDWQSVPVLMPWIEAAEVVVCSGYSTVMEAAVAGTPCVIYPFTDEQHGFSRVMERAGLAGFQIEHSIPHVVRAARKPPTPPAYENGIDDVADVVVDHLRR